MLRRAFFAISFQFSFFDGMFIFDWLSLTLSSFLAISFGCIFFIAIAFS